MELQTYFSGALLKIGRARNRGDEYVYQHNLDAPAEAGSRATGLSGGIGPAEACDMGVDLH